MIDLKIVQAETKPQTRQNDATDKSISDNAISDNAISDNDVLDFALRLRGRLISPGSPEYDEARQLWNGMIDKHPALIVRCHSAQDVVASVDFARTHGLPLAVRGGGHNVAGLASCDDGIVVDFSEMKAVTVDAEQKLAYAQPGATLSDLDAATQAHGLATPLGVVSETGIAGLTLGGGYGHLRRKYGLSCDALYSAEIVTADGRLLHVSEDENADLFWGIRGGGGNFGIVTQLVYKLYPLGPEVFLGFTLYPAHETKRVVRAVEAFLEEVPENYAPIGFVGRVPAVEDFPQEIHHQPFVGLLGVYVGDAEEGERVLQPMREICEPLVDMSGIMTYTEAQMVLDEDYPTGMNYYWKSTSLPSLPDAAIDKLLHHLAQMPSDHSTIDFWFNGGAMAEIPANATAYGDRSAMYLINPEANWENALDAEANISWVRAVIADMEPFSNGGMYLNFSGFQEEGEALVRKGFGKNYARLVELKNKYDPTNFFGLNQNIKPSV